MIEEHTPEPATNPESETPLTESPEFPDKPPITEDALECIVMPKPASGNTLTRYVMTNGERYAKFEELTAEEKEAALCFILKYAAPLVVNRKPRRIEPVCDIELDNAELDRLLEGK